MIKKKKSNAHCKLYTVRHDRRRRRRVGYNSIIIIYARAQWKPCQCIHTRHTSYLVYARLYYYYYYTRCAVLIIIHKIYCFVFFNESINNNNNDGESAEPKRACGSVFCESPGFFSVFFFCIFYFFRARIEDRHFESDVPRGGMPS